MGKSFAKLWMNLWQDEWFLSLNALSRSVFIQLILWCKDNRDDGTVLFVSWRSMGQTFGCDHKTVKRKCEQFNKDGKITLEMVNPTDNGGEKAREIPQQNSKSGARVGHAWGTRGEKAREIPQRIILILIRNYLQYQEDETVCRPSKKIVDKTRQDKTRESLPPLIKEIQLAYNDICKDLPKIKQPEQVTSSRRRALKQRIKALPTLAGWCEFFQKVHESDHLCRRLERTGEHKNWIATFDFLIKEQYFTRIIEGAYDQNKKRTTNYGKSGRRVL